MALVTIEEILGSLASLSPSVWQLSHSVSCFVQFIVSVFDRISHTLDVLCDVALDVGWDK